MDLKQRRLIQTYTEATLPKVQAELNQACGKNIEVVVEWEGFSSDSLALEQLSLQCLDRLTTAFNWICKDSVGKEAVRESINLIRVQNVAIQTQRRLELSDGVLTITGVWSSSGWDGIFHENEIHRFLESAL
jgi:hypothetical protein